MANIRRKNGNITKEYRAWKAMKARCYSVSCKNNRDYQLKGIQVCPRWKNSFENFFTDMGSCPNGHSLDRIDNDGHYTPKNCRWATSFEQAKNRGNFNLVFTYNGKTQVLKDWARELNIKYTTLYLRLTRSKLPFEQAIQQDAFNRLIEYKGKKKTLVQWSKELNIPYQLISDRKHRGWSIIRIFEQKINNSKI